MSFIQADITRAPAPIGRRRTLAAVPPRASGGPRRDREPIAGRIGTLFTLALFLATAAVPLAVINALLGVPLGL